MTSYRKKSVDWNPATFTTWSAPPASASSAGPAPPRLKSPHGTDQTTLSHINTQLDRLHRQAGANEEALGRLLVTWRAHEPTDAPAYWLTLARIAELTLLTAGAYADGCEFQAAGDLLANPAQVRIHLKDRHLPVVKPRHGAISAALRSDLAPNRSFMAWFRDNAILEVTRRAILPDLTETMALSNRFAAPYIDHFKARTTKVVDAITFLSAWQVAHVDDLHTRLQASPPDTRDFIQANLCHFSDLYFTDMGALIAQAQHNRAAQRSRTALRSPVVLRSRPPLKGSLAGRQ
jgi:hypothetical protein